MTPAELTAIEARHADCPTMRPCDASVLLAALRTEQEARARVERLMTNLRDYGHQPMYNGRPSCPFCGNFVDDEQTHEPACELVAALAPDASEGGEK